MRKSKFLKLQKIIRTINYPSKIAQLPGVDMSATHNHQQTLRMLSRNTIPLREVVDIHQHDEYQTEGQHPLKLDETQLQSTGKSVSVDDVLAKIDELTTDND